METKTKTFIACTCKVKNKMLMGLSAKRIRNPRGVTQYDNHQRSRVYQLIFGSKLESAKAFQNWVVHGGEHKTILKNNR